MTRSGWFQLKRLTIARRMRAKLVEVKDQLRRRMHQSIPANPVTMRLHSPSRRPLASAIAESSPCWRRPRVRQRITIA